MDFYFPFSLSPFTVLLLGICGFIPVSNVFAKNIREVLSAFHLDDPDQD